MTRGFPAKSSQVHHEKRRVRAGPALILGTPAAGAATFGLCTLNGSPFPAWGQWRSMLSYPTGSPYTYFAVIWVIYFLAVAMTASRQPRSRSRPR